MEPDYIELNTFLRVQKIVHTGGKAKLLIRSGAVKVNGVVETRNRKKLFENDKVLVGEIELMVEKRVLKNR